MSAQSRKLARRLAAIPAAVKQAVVPALLKSGEELAGRMKHLAPKDTGALADSIAVTPPGSSTPPYSQPGGSRVAAENQVLVTAGNDGVRYRTLSSTARRTLQRSRISGLPIACRGRASRTASSGRHARP